MYTADNMKNLCHSLEPKTPIVAEYQMIDSLGRPRQSGFLGVYADAEDFKRRGIMHVDKIRASIEGANSLQFKISATRPVILG